MKKFLINALCCFIPIKKYRKRMRERLQRVLSVSGSEASSGESMRYFARLVTEYSSLLPRNVFEIGANYGQDAEALRKYFGLKPNDIWVFEAHPDIFKEVVKRYSFNAYNAAVYNAKKKMTFQAVNIDKGRNTGISSLLNHRMTKEEMETITVDAIRMDDFMREHGIDSIDFLKLDAEGCTYEVLEGFGNRLADVKAIHVEAEHEEIWEGQRLYGDVARMLDGKGFVQIYFQRHFSQSDSFWMKKEYLLKEGGTLS